MKIERINDNQIRCTLTSFDLSVRNINLVELAYGTEKARKLFREMIQKASNEVGFEAEDIPLMVEAIPLSSESIMLVITKIEDPEELDTRFAKFSPFTEDHQNPLRPSWPVNSWQGAENPLNYLGTGYSREEAQNNTDSAVQGPDNAKRKRVLSAAPVYSVSAAWTGSVKPPGRIDGIYNGVNTLYKKTGYPPVLSDCQAPGLRGPGLFKGVQYPGGICCKASP